MYLLDTDILTLAHVGHSGIADHIRQVGEEQIARTVITEIEILRGRYEYVLKTRDAEQLLKAQELLQKSQEMLADITVVTLDPSPPPSSTNCGGTKNSRRSAALTCSLPVSHLHKMPSLLPGM